MNADQISYASIAPCDVLTAFTPIAELRTSAATAEFDLHQRDVHVWMFRAVDAHAIPDKFARILSPDEWARANRYRSPKHAARFGMHRAALRILLARYLDTSANALAFSYGAQGKPQLCDVKPGVCVHFNIAHCGPVAVYAFASCGPVGVDVERDRTLHDLDSLIAQVLSPREQAALEGLDSAAKQRTFWRCWTQKEAVMKALGVGLSMPPTAVEVAARVGLPAGIVVLPPAWGDAQAWLCHELAISDHVAMLVAPAEGLLVTMRALTMR
jgi:4'-phosphopantetheinyl transferase